MTDYARGPQPSADFFDAVAKMDAGELEVIVTDDDQAADWARGNGYRVTGSGRHGLTIYEIRAGTGRVARSAAPARTTSDGG